MTSFTQYASLAKQTVFISGGATGIGACLVEAFHAQGARVGFVDCDRSAGEALIQGLGGQALAFVACDVTDTTAFEQAMQTVRDQLGPVSVLINNVANDRRQPFATLSLEQWRQAMAINLEPAFVASKMCSRDMVNLGGGAIVNISSINAYTALPDLCAYSTAKAGILGLTRSLAHELGRDSIRANAVLPGWVMTERQAQLYLTPESEQAWFAQVPLKRRLLPKDIANTVLFLASADAACITGQEFVVDCGHL